MKIFIREGIVEKIAWKENGFTLTTPGKNGLDAKEIIERERAGYCTYGY